jgi:predicted neuraminidase
MAIGILRFGFVDVAAGQQALTTDGLMRLSPLGYEDAYLPTGAHSNHAANLIQLKNGDLLCFWFGGAAEGQSGVAIL